MGVNHAVNLNLSAAGVPPVLHMAQYDANSRTIVATLWDGTSGFTIPTGASVMVRFGKPDGTGGLYDETEAGDAITYSGNVVTAPVAAQMLSVAGKVHANIEIYQNGATEQAAVKLATFCFVVNVEKAAYQDAEMMSSDYYNIVTAYIAKVLAVNAHPPQISSNGYWQMWDMGSEAYIATTYPSRGEPGEKGEPGGYTVLGMYATLSELEAAHPTGSAGDAWFVGIPGSNVVYQWDVDREAWVNVGSLRGEKGATGATFTPSLASTGALSWTNNGGLANPATINIRGPRGPAGARGLEGKSAYEAAQEGGYEGTESEFNVALAGIGSKATKSTALTVTLPVSGWSTTAKTQTVTASGVTAEDHLVITAAPASFVPYSQAGVRCSGQAADQLTFLCETIPTEELTVQVLVVG